MIALWDHLWILWGIVTLGGFGVIEAFALTRDKREGATLSQHIRRWFNTKTHNGRVVFVATAVIVPGLLFGWLIPHILGGTA